MVAAYSGLLAGALGSQIAIANTLVEATPYILAGLAVALGFKCGLFNIGVEGQLGMGAICAAVAGAAFVGMPAIIHLPLAILAGVGLDMLLRRLWGLRLLAPAALVILLAGFGWNAVTLMRLHPYEYLVFNPLVGGLEGATRRYATDYWFTIMPEAVDELEAYLARTEPVASRDPNHSYSVAICGERASFVKKAQPHLRWAEVWETADFFIAPTHMNCDRDSNGEIIATVRRLNVPLGYVKDQRLTRDAARPAG